MLQNCINIDNTDFTDERSLFRGEDLLIRNCTFDKGESPLKHSKNIILKNSEFRWKYPLWYTDNASLNEVKLTDTARAGIWYSTNIKIISSVIDAPKTFRRSDHIFLDDIVFTNAAETLWTCDTIEMNKTVFNGDYVLKDSRNIKMTDSVINGNYAFDGCENLHLERCIFNTKDAFWNTKNVYCKDCTIIGEYIGWNSENLVFENCTVESLQGFCYISNLEISNCRLENTSLAFEYSDVHAVISGNIESIINPSSGYIKADGIGKLILEKERIDLSKTNIDCDNIGIRLDKNDM